MTFKWAAATTILILVALGDAPAFSEPLSDAHLNFLFSDDNQISALASELPANEPHVDSKMDIREDKWLNAPLTRLDYVLIRINELLNRSVREIVVEDANIYFEKSKVHMPTSVGFNVWFSDETGRLFIKASISNAGKPKRPLKEVCDNLLRSLRMKYPLRSSLYSLWYDGALGILARDISSHQKAYRDEIRKLAESTVLVGNVSSEYQGADRKDGLFSVVCVQKKQGGEISYYKSSQDLTGFGIPYYDSGLSH